MIIVIHADKRISYIYYVPHARLKNIKGKCHAQEPFKIEYDIVYIFATTYSHISKLHRDIQLLSILMSLKVVCLN